MDTFHNIFLAPELETLCGIITSFEVLACNDSVVQSISYLLYEEFNLFFLYNFYIVSVGSFIRFLCEFYFVWI